MPIIIYGAAETTHLSAADPVLGAYIKTVGPIERVSHPDTFAALIQSIVGQQISVKAQASIWARLKKCCGDINPTTIAGQSTAALRAAGLSGRKVEYIQEAAKRTLAGEFDWQNLGGYSDEELISHLTTLRGVGRWTVEMLLLFSLLRPNILSYDDLAIRRGICYLYGWESINKKQFQVLRNLYSPYGSIASLYLWHRAAE